MPNTLDFSICSNPLGMPESVRTALLEAVTDAQPDDYDGFEELRTTIGARHGTVLSHVALAQDEEELFTLLAAKSKGVRRALLPTPCPKSYERALISAGIAIKKFRLRAENKFTFSRGDLAKSLSDCEMLLMGNPAWPASTLISPSELLTELDAWLGRGGWLILDESAIDFTYGSVTNSLWSALRREARTAIIRSFTNSLALHLCPLCYAVGGEAWIADVRRAQFKPELSPLACHLSPALSRLTGFRAQTVEYVTHLMPRLIGRLNRISGLRPLTRDANWVLCHLQRDDWTVEQLAAALKDHDILISPCIDGSYFTLALRKPIETDRFVKAAREILMPKKKDWGENLPIDFPR